MCFFKKCLILTASAVIVAGIARGEEAKREYIGNNQCKVCHSKKAEGDQWNVWKSMKHAHAMESLHSDKAAEYAKARGITKPAYEAPECVKCHVTGYDVEKMAAPAAIKPEDGVQCESCHGPASNHVDDGKAVMFKKKTAQEVDWLANLNKIEEATCLKCHNDESPSWNPEQFTKEDGTKVGFDFEQAKKLIAHPIPGREHPAAK